MGRTVPTFRQLIEDAVARWSKFRRALRREDQEYFDRLFRRVRSYTQAATYQASDNPMEAILLSVALDQEKRLEALERAVHPEKIAVHQEHPELSGSRTVHQDRSPQVEQLDAHLEPEPGCDPGAEPLTDPAPLTDRGLDPRPLPEPARDETVADHAGADAPPAD